MKANKINKTKKVNKDKILNGSKVKPMPTDTHHSKLKAPLASFIVSLPIFFLGQSALALSLGTAEVESHIGQKLQVFIPLDSVNNGVEGNLNTLKAEILIPENTSTPALSILKDFDRKGLLISSENIVNDVFISFSIKTNLDGNQRVYEFTTLLDPLSQESEKIESGEIFSASNNQKTNPLLMGPTETVLPGSTPKERFGPVINGQSLARVARRINKAYGISIEKMMWNLFKANPKSFLTDSIDSLAAGSILTIPRKSELIDLPIDGISNSQKSSAIVLEQDKVDTPVNAGAFLSGKTSNDSAAEKVITSIDQNEFSTQNNQALTLNQLDAIESIENNLKNINNRLEHLHNRQLEQNERLKLVENIKEKTAITLNTQETVATTEIAPKVASTLSGAPSTEETLTTTKSSSSKLILVSILSVFSGLLIGIAIALRGQHLLKEVLSKVAHIKAQLKEKLKEKFEDDDTEENWEQEVATPTNDYSNLKSKKKESKSKKVSKAIPRPRIGMELSTEKELDWQPQPNFQFSKVKKEKRRTKKQLKDELRIQESLKALQDNAMDDMVLEKYKIGSDIFSDTKPAQKHSYSELHSTTEESIELKSEFDSYLSMSNEEGEKSIDIHLDDLSITISEPTSKKEETESFIVLESPQVTQISIVDGDKEKPTKQKTSKEKVAQPQLEVIDESEDKNNSIDFDEDFTVMNENSIAFEEAQLIDLIISLSNNKEYETAHSILDGCGEASEHIDYCRLHILSNESNIKDFLKLYARIERRFDEIDEQLVNDIKALKETLEENSENDVIEFSQKKRARS